MAKVKYLLIVTMLLTALSFAHSAGEREPAEIPDEPEDTVVIYSNFRLEAFEQVADRFTEETGIEVELIQAGSGELFTRARAEQHAPQADIIWTGYKPLWEENLDLLEPYTSINDGVIPDWAKHPERYYYGTTVSIQALMVNTELLSEEDYPRRWTDLTDPKYRGEIVLANPALSTSAHAQLVAMLEAFDFDWDMIGDVIRNSTITSSSRVVWQGTADGEYAIGATSDQNAIIMADQGYPSKLIYPEDGVPFEVTGMGIVKGAPHPRAAREWVDFVLSEETLGMLAEFGWRTVMPHIQPDWSVDYPMDSLTVLDIDYERSAREYTQDLEKFDDVFADVN